MKPNIDLTQNQIFSSRRANAPHKLISPSYVKNGVPWSGNKYAVKSSIIPTEQQLVFLGDRNQRKESRYIGKVISGNYCDCCGKYLLHKPWESRVFNLCYKCYDRLNENTYDFLSW